VRLFLVFGCVIAVACASRPDVRLVREAAAALGGVGAVEDVETLVVEGEGESYWLGENRSLSSELPAFAVTFTRTYDWTNGRLRFEEIRTPTFLTGNPNPRQIVESLDGDVAFDVAPDGKAIRAPVRVARDRRAVLLHHPIGIVRAALAEGAQVGGMRTEGSDQVVEVTPAGGDRLTLVLDGETKLPVRVAARAHHAFLGDVIVVTGFAEYRGADGLKLPTAISSRIDDHVIARMRVSRQTINGGVGRLEAPAVIRSAQPAPPPPLVNVEEVAPGVWRLTGGTHHSVVVELRDRVVLIDAPLDEARARAVIGKARELRPDRPLTHVIVTHHHFDHAGGVRAAVAEGLTLVARAGAMERFLETVVQRPHTLAPDALAKKPRPLKVERVESRYVLGDAGRRLEVYPITGSAYADTLVMVYLPAERLLVEADVFSPVESLGYAWTRYGYPFASNFAENIQSRKLKVDRIVPLHGQIVPLSDLLRIAH
jgi:glyoxylase-like metal-dependent hydrolase (beta-lactamase superfamily II)